MTGQPSSLRRRIRIVAWLSSMGGGLATAAIVAGVTHTAATPSTDQTTNASTATSSSGSSSRVDVPPANTSALGGSNGS